MTDVIGHPLEIGDYVTAVWGGGELQLFEIVEFRNAGMKRRNSRMRQRYNEIGLSRTWKDGNIKAETQIKTVFKMPNQVTWVDKNFVALYFLSR
jgi:hypothetical protein